MKINLMAIGLVCVLALGGCSSFKAQRVDADKGDDKALAITDKWVLRDTENAVKDIVAQIQNHGGFKEYQTQLRRKPRVFIMEVQNETSEAYFPIADMNDELLNEFSASGKFILIDNQAREKILKEISYQADGMVNKNQLIKIGQQSGADLIILGAVRMNPETRDGQTLKQYTVNITMTDLKTSEEVLRTRHKAQKYSAKSKFGW